MTQSITDTQREEINIEINRILNEAMHNNSNICGVVDLYNLNIEYFSNWIEFIKSLDREKIPFGCVMETALAPFISKYVSVAMEFVEKKEEKKLAQVRELLLHTIGTVFDNMVKNCQALQKG